MGLLHVLQTVPSNTQPKGGTRVRNDRHIFTSEQEPGERLREPAWWLMAVIQAVGRLEQEDWHEFKSSLGYRMRLVSKTQRERAGVWRRGQTDR